MDSNLVTIAQFAKMCRTTVRTVRFYDSLDLIKPVRVDKFTKYRYYSPFQTRDFFRIKLLQNFAVPLENVAQLLKKEDASKFLADKTLQIEAEIIQKQKELRFVREIHSLLFETKSLESVTKIESVGPFYIFGKYFEKEAYHTITQHLIEVQNAADKLGIPHFDKQAVFYKEPEKYKPKDTKIEVTILCKRKLSKNFKLPQDYFFKKMPKVKCYVTKYVGPFEFITLIYEKLHQLRIVEKLPVTFAPFDIHLNALDPTVSPYDHLTKICFPIRSLQSKSK